MAAVTGLTLVKRFTYRGDAGEEFSNTYHFKGPPPGDDASWTVLMNDAVAKERQVLANSVTYARAYGYNSDASDAHHVFAYDFSVPGPPPTGSATPTGGIGMAGDQAACVWWKMNRLSSRGKPIYLRKYFHHGWIDQTTPDNLEAGYKSGLTDFAGPLGIQQVHGGLRSPTTDDSVVVGGVIPYVTTRTLKRRGKRPPPPG